jgi:hypothetical protein
MQQSIETFAKFEYDSNWKKYWPLKIICSAQCGQMYLFGSALNSNFNDNSDWFFS